MKVLGERIYTTDDGRHVREGHPDAAFLAYAVGDEVPDKVVAELGDGPKPAQKRAPAKSRKPAANKARSKPADKSGDDNDGGDGDPDHPKPPETDPAGEDDK